MLTSGVVITAISTIATIIFKLIAVKMENNRALEEAKLKALNAEATVTKDAREYENRGFQFTRRFIAVMLTIFVIAVPYLSILWYQWMYPIDIVAGQMYPLVYFGYEVLDKGFWPFTADSTITVWKEFKGIVITQWHTDMFAIMMGLYFGNRIGNGRM